jgi:sirohydrochlorin cobaltochelatase
MSPSPERGVVLFAHGARDPEWARPFEGIKARIQERLPGLPVVLAYLEFMSPPLEDAIDALAAQGVRVIDVVPVFMARAGHVKRDLPLILDALRRKHPHVTIRLAPAVGEAGPVMDAIADWVVTLTDEHPD